MNYGHYDQFNKYLSADEYILWQGKPGSKRPLMAGDVFTFIFGLFWSGFVCYFFYSAIRSKSLPPILFTLPFAAIALYLLFGRFIHERIINKNTSYIITNKKIIRIYKGNADILYLNELPLMQTQLYKNGSGTISFNIGYRYNIDRRNHRQMRFQLVNIPDCAMVEQIILDNSAAHEPINY